MKQIKNLGQFILDLGLLYIKCHQLNSTKDGMGNILDVFAILSQKASGRPGPH
jgi:hypothetical protein